MANRSEYNAQIEPIEGPGWRVLEMAQAISNPRIVVIRIEAEGNQQKQISMYMGSYIQISLWR